MPDTPSVEREEQGHDESRGKKDLIEELNHLRMENAYLKKLTALVQASDQQAQRTER